MSLTEEEKERLGKEEEEGAKEVVASIDEFLESPSEEEEEKKEPEKEKEEPEKEEKEEKEPEKPEKEEEEEEEKEKGKLKEEFEEEKEPEKEEKEEEKEEEEPEKKEEADRRDALIEKLSADLLQAGVAPKEKEPEKEEEEKEKEKKEEKPAELLTDEQFAEILQDKGKFSEFLTKLLDKSSEGLLTVIPGVFEKMMKDALDSRAASANFYRANPDLAPNHRYLVLTGRAVRSEHPEWSNEDVLKEVETRARADLGKPKSKVKPKEGKEEEEEVDKKEEKPAFAPGTKGKKKLKKKGEVSDLEKDIIDTIKDVE